MEEGEREMLSPPAPRSFLSLTSYHLKCALFKRFLEKKIFVDICILNELIRPARSSTVVGSCNGKKKNLLSFS